MSQTFKIILKDGKREHVEADSISGPDKDAGDMFFTVERDGACIGKLAVSEVVGWLIQKPASATDFATGG
ncbi:MAG: hypothetical protein OXN16_10255 [Gammaproteobacteria bacterium]|nr:hypothetical protein [Gammaproteobacteria bacterium]